MPTTLDTAQTKVALWVLAEFKRRRRIVGQPIPAAVADLHTHLLMSACGPSPEPARAQSKPAEQVDTLQAADLLGITPRHVRRLARDLDGQRIGRQWVFNRTTVIDYAQGRTHHGTTH
ncbi:helix-turn-helix domain-containing protein [Gordonia sp. NPDC003422]